MASRSRKAKRAAARPQAAPRLEPPPNEFTAKDRLRLAAALLLILAVLATWGQFDFGDIMGYYDMFADALLDGRLELRLRPDQVNLVDMVPYQGRYYFQWGPFPVLFHLAARPFGLHLSDRVASILAGLLASLVFFEVIVLLRRRFFPALEKSACVWFFFAFALATPNALTTLRGTVYNEVIGYAALLVLAAFWAFLRCQERLQARWVFLCGLAIGCALLTRVTTAVYAAGFFVFLAALERLRGRSAREAVARLALFCLPILVCLGLHAANNQARFGSPYSFGREFKPESIENPDVQPFSLLYVGENLGHYLLSAPRLSLDFPYIAHEGRRPLVRVTRAEAMSSLLLGSPFLLFAAFAFPLLGDRRRPADLRLTAAAALGSGLLMFAVMMTFGAASRRYMQDFVPLLMIGAFIGFAAWRETGAGKRWQIPAGALLLFCALLNIQVPFYQSFCTPTPDLNVMRAFVALAPAVGKILPGENLNREAAIAANDIGTVLLKEGAYAEAAAAFERAASFDPPADVLEVVERNLGLARRGAGRR